MNDMDDMDDVPDEELALEWKRKRDLERWRAAQPPRDPECTCESYLALGDSAYSLSMDVCKIHHPDLWQKHLDYLERARKEGAAKQARLDAILAATIATLPPCNHGVPGGCEVTCYNCTHTCKRHLSDGCRVRGCMCEAYNGTEG